MKFTFIFLISILFIFSCNTSENNKIFKNKNEYPAYIVKSFMDGCLEDNTNPGVTQTLICSCLIEKIQSKYKLEEYLELSKEQHGLKWDEYQLFLQKASEE